MMSQKWDALSLLGKLDVINAVDKQPARKTVDIARDLALPCVAFSSNHKRRKAYILKLFNVQKPKLQK